MARNIGKLVISNQAWMLGLANATFMGSSISRDYLDIWDHALSWWALAVITALLYAAAIGTYHWCMPLRQPSHQARQEDGDERVPASRQIKDDFGTLFVKGAGWTLGIFIYFACLKSFNVFNDALDGVQDGSIWLFAIPEFGVGEPVPSTLSYLRFYAFVCQSLTCQSLHHFVVSLLCPL